MNLNIAITISMFSFGSFALHLFDTKNRIIQLDTDSSAQILMQLDRESWKNCQLVCWQWRAMVDCWKKDYLKVGKRVPVISFIEENDFRRMINLTEGCKLIQQKKPKDAFAKLSDAATYKGGNAQAIYCIGHMFLRGLGVQRSIREGLYQLQNAADAGFVNAFYDLGLFFYTSKVDDEFIGRPDGRSDYTNYRHAFGYFEKASDLSHIKATYHLGRMYYLGHHVAQNLDEAQRLMIKAADEGYDVAIEALKAIAK